MTLHWGYVYVTKEQAEVLQQILALTSVDNDRVRELRQVFQVAPQLEKVLYDEEGDDRWALKCPHCGALSKDGEDPEYDMGVRVLDFAIRSSDFAYNHDDSAIHGYYNDDYSWEGYGYECGACGGDVSLPPEISEEGD